MTAWAVYPGDEKVLCHVIPVADFREHELTGACWCHPRPSEDDDCVLLHNAMDQRDRLERGEIRLQ